MALALDGERARSLRIAASNCASDSAGVGPRRHGPSADAERCSRARARRTPSATPPTVDTPARDRSAAPSSRRSFGSSSRPPRRQGRRRSAARARDRSSSLSIDSSPMCRLAASSSAASGSPACSFRPRSRPAQRPDLPPLQAIDLHTDFTRNRVERLATQQPQHHIPFPARAPPLSRRQGPDPIAAASAPTPVALRAPSVGADPAPFTCLDRTRPPPPGDIGFSLIRVQEDWGAQFTGGSLQLLLHRTWTCLGYCKRFAGTRSVTHPVSWTPVYATRP